MRFSFPQITRSDKPFLLALYAVSRADEMALVPWSEEQKSAFIQSQFQAQHQHYTAEFPQALFQTIDFEGEKIGRLYVCELADEIHIIDLIILPEFRGRGFGTEIVSDILQKAAKPVSIYLESFNQSNGLFKRLGFQKISEEGFYQFWQYAEKKSLNKTA